jgi:hypothetical protein
MKAKGVLDVLLIGSRCAQASQFTGVANPETTALKLIKSAHLRQSGEFICVGLPYREWSFRQSLGAGDGRCVLVQTGTPGDHSVSKIAKVHR